MSALNPQFIFDGLLKATADAVNSASVLIELDAISVAEYEEILAVHSYQLQVSRWYRATAPAPCAPPARRNNVIPFRPLVDKELPAWRASGPKAK